MGASCSDNAMLNFNFATTTGKTRAWEIKVTQVECGSRSEYVNFEIIFNFYSKYKVVKENITYIEILMKSFHITAQIVDAYNIMKELPEEWKPSIGLRLKQLQEQPVFSVIYHLNSKFDLVIEMFNFHIGQLTK